MSAPKNAESVARELIDAFRAADTQRMRSLLAGDLRAYITNREGGVDEVGAEEYLLHNHAAHCIFVRDGLVTEWWMVEALPAESDAFWAS